MTSEQNGVPGGPLQLSGGPRVTHTSARKMYFCIPQYARHNAKLVLEMSFTGKDHRDAVLIGGGDYLIIDGNCSATDIYIVNITKLFLLAGLQLDCPCEL